MPTLTVASDYSSNPTVFGRILEGTLPAKVVEETELLLCFEDISPASEHHILIIPKRRIAHAAALTPADLPLLEAMVAAAERVAKARGVADVRAARAAQTLSIGFHMFPCISVSHLHLHVIFPMPARSCIKRLKFPPGYSPWYLSPEAVAVRFCGGALAAPIRIVQWNVRRFTGANGECSVAAVAEVLKKLRPTLVSLNEVDVGKWPDALPQLAAALGMCHHFFGHARGGQYGNALLSASALTTVAEVGLEGGSVVSHPKDPSKKHRIGRGLLVCDAAPAAAMVLVTDSLPVRAIARFTTRERLPRRCQIRRQSTAEATFAESV